MSIYDDFAALLAQLRPGSSGEITSDNVGQFNRELLLRSFEEIPQRENVAPVVAIVPLQTDAVSFNTTLRRMEEEARQRIMASMGVPSHILTGTPAPIPAPVPIYDNGRLLGAHVPGSWGPHPEGSTGQAAVTPTQTRGIAEAQTHSPAAIGHVISMSMAEVRDALAAVLPVTPGVPAAEFHAEHQNEWALSDTYAVFPPAMLETLRTHSNQNIERHVMDEMSHLDTAVMETVLSEFMTPELGAVLTPYQEELLQLRPEVGDVWGFPENPIHWRMLTCLSPTTVEFGGYCHEYPENLTRSEFRQQIREGYQLIYRQPDKPGAEFARLQIRSEAALTQAPPVQTHRRALRLRNVLQPEMLVE